MIGQLIESIKKISANAQTADEPMAIAYGNVINESPVEILTGQKMILDEKRLIFTEWTRSISTEAEIAWQSETADEHSHSISGKKAITFDNSLKTGDRVIMLKMQGGQKYIVLGRAVNEE